MDCFFLYIDILGFSTLVKNEPEKIPKLYEAIDSLNVHSHDSFNTIIFSDTILVYPKDDFRLDSVENITMWLVEFAQDLFEFLYTNDSAHFLMREMLRFEKIFNLSRKHPKPEVRIKYLTYLDFYRKRYGMLLNEWEANGFDMNKIIPSPKWKELENRLLKEYE